MRFKFLIPGGETETSETEDVTKPPFLPRLVLSSPVDRVVLNLDCAGSISWSDRYAMAVRTNLVMDTTGIEGQ